MHTLLDLHPQFQATADFAEIAASGVKGVYIKATEGATFTAAGYADMQRRARRQNLRTGFYHFLRPQAGRSGAAEARHFWQAVEGINAGSGERAQLMRLVADVEVTQLDPADTRRYVRRFVDELKALSGHTPVLYTFPFFLDTWGEELGGLPLWIAHYGVDRPRLPKPFTEWTMWQYTDEGRNPGVAGHVDKNKCPRLADLILERGEY